MCVMVLVELMCRKCSDILRCCVSRLVMCMLVVLCVMLNLLWKFFIVRLWFFFVCCRNVMDVVFGMR